MNAHLPADVNTPTDEPVLPGGLTRTEARQVARERFKERVTNGDPVGCECHSDEAIQTDGAADHNHGIQVAGVRFLDSGQTYYFTTNVDSLLVGDWVIVETNRGREAARVVIAPHQILENQLEGDLKPIFRRMDADDVGRMEHFKRESATAVKTFGSVVRARRVSIKPISASYHFDGSVLTLHYSVSRDNERIDLRDLTRELGRLFDCRIELKQVGPRDEAKLLGGLGRCGRTLCCSSWLPVYPEISMGMAKTQDLALNPTKVSGVCGRLLCCLSYENEQYRQIKSVMPRLGQRVDTPKGSGLVMSMQVLRELVTVRFDDDQPEETFAAADLGFAPKQRSPQTTPRDDISPDSGESASEANRKRRRRRRKPSGMDGAES